MLTCANLLQELHEFRRDLEEKRRDLLARELRPEVRLVHSLLGLEKTMLSNQIYFQEACLWESMQLGLSRLSMAGLVLATNNKIMQGVHVLLTLFRNSVEQVSRIDVPQLLEAFRMAYRIYQLRLSSFQVGVALLIPPICFLSFS